MTTTHLFVELVVIGVGAFIWIALLVLSLFGLGDWIPKNQAFWTGAAIPLLSIVYVLGIISDRIADAIFDKW